MQVREIARALDRAWGPSAQCPSPSSAVSQDAFASYLFEAGPALAEAQAGAGVGFDHHLSVLLSLGRVVEPAPHGMAPVRRG